MDVQNSEVTKQAKGVYGIGIWRIQEVMNEMIKDVIATIVYGDRVV